MTQGKAHSSPQNTCTSTQLTQCERNKLLLTQQHIAEQTLHQKQQQQDATTCMQVNNHSFFPQEFGRISSDTCFRLGRSWLLHTHTVCSGSIGLRLSTCQGPG